MIAPVRCGGERSTIVVSRPAADADARVPGDPFDASHEHRRAEHSAAVLESRSEIEDLDRATGRVRSSGNQDGGVVQVVLLAARALQQLDREKSNVLAFAGALFQE